MGGAVLVCTNIGVQVTASSECNLTQANHVTKCILATWFEATRECFASDMHVQKKNCKVNCTVAKLQYFRKLNLLMDCMYVYRMEFGTPNVVNY